MKKVWIVENKNKDFKTDLCTTFMKHEQAKMSLRETPLDIFNKSSFMVSSLLSEEDMKGDELYYRAVLLGGVH